MEFSSRRLVMYQHLNPAGRLFGGQALAWIDEEAASFAVLETKCPRLVTKKMSEVEFTSPGCLGDLVSIGCKTVRVGTTSITVCCEIRNQTTNKLVVEVKEIVFVTLDEQGKPMPHGLTKTA